MFTVIASMFYFASKDMTSFFHVIFQTVFEAIYFIFLKELFKQIFPCGEHQGPRFSLH